MNDAEKKSNASASGDGEDEDEDSDEYDDEDNESVSGFVVFAHFGFSMQASLPLMTRLSRRSMRPTKMRDRKSAKRRKRRRGLSSWRKMTTT